MHVWWASFAIAIEFGVLFIFLGSNIACNVPVMLPFCLEENLQYKRPKFDYACLYVKLT